MASPSPKNISITKYSYELPEEKIAAYPLAERDASKLLIYKEGNITEDIYHNLADHLQPGSLLIFNDTKVIRARIRFQKSTGGMIEIFCLEPNEIINEYQTVMSRTGLVRWKCMIGGAGKWKEGSLEKRLMINGQEIILAVKLIQKLPDAYIAEFSWLPNNFTFAEIIEVAGDMPLPPYIKRSATLADTKRYQTIFAHQQGSVAAPTAGLHFTPYILDQLKERQVDTSFVTLHVGAGTFKPVKAAVMEAHDMHAEWIDVSTQTIKKILSNLDQNIVAVGTTSLRTIESLYWLGVKASNDPALLKLELSQWEVYDDLHQLDISPVAALHALLNWMKGKSIEHLFTHTKILIAPGYQFKIADSLITNFHQPGSTLLLLVAAAIGDDWKKVYQFALDNEFRFLSYGDGCLLNLRK